MRENKIGQTLSNKVAKRKMTTKNTKNQQILTLTLILISKTKIYLNSKILINF